MQEGGESELSHLASNRIYEKNHKQKDKLKIIYLSPKTDANLVFFKQFAVRKVCKHQLVPHVYLKL